MPKGSWLQCISFDMALWMKLKDLSAGQGPVESQWKSAKTIRISQLLWLLQCSFRFNGTHALPALFVSTNTAVGSWLFFKNINIGKGNAIYRSTFYGCLVAMIIIAFNYRLQTYDSTSVIMLKHSSHHSQYDTLWNGNSETLARKIIQRIDSGNFLLGLVKDRV